MATKRQFDVFRLEVERCVKLLGLNGWLVRVHDTGCGAGSDADVHPDVHQRTADIYLSETTHFRSDKYLKELARHEVSHILLADYTDKANSYKYAPRKALEKEEEKLANRIGSLLMRVE